MKVVIIPTKNIQITKQTSDMDFQEYTSRLRLELLHPMQCSRSMTSGPSLDIYSLLQGKSSPCRVGYDADIHCNILEEGIATAFAALSLGFKENCPTYILQTQLPLLQVYTRYHNLKVSNSDHFPPFANSPSTLSADPSASLLQGHRPPLLSPQCYHICSHP